MRKLPILFVSVLLLWNTNSLAATIYIDDGVTCTGDYSIASRDCSGADGNCYATIAAGVGALSAGDTLYIRAGTYTENDETISQPGAFGSMTTISGYGSETVTWQNDDIYYMSLKLQSSADNLTISKINFSGVRFIAASSRTWTNEAGDVWYHDGTDVQITEFKKDSAGWSNISESANKEALASDGDWFQDYPGDTTMFLYSDSDPNNRTDLRETGQGVSIGNNSSSTGYIVVDGCAFDGQGHCHIKGGYQWWIKNCTFANTGTDTNDHHVYSWGVHSSGNEAVYEYNYFKTNSSDMVIGASVLCYGYGYQIPETWPKYHIVRYNISLSEQTTVPRYHIALNCEYSKGYGNTIYGGNRSFNINGNYNEAKNNICSKTNYTGFVFEGDPAHDNVVTYNIIYDYQYAWPTSGTCTDCTISNNITGSAPGWVDSTPTIVADVRLLESSAAVDAGTDLGVDHDDILDPSDIVWPLSTVAQSGWEIGAFAYLHGTVFGSGNGAVTFDSGGSGAMGW